MRIGNYRTHSLKRHRWDINFHWKSLRFNVLRMHWGPSGHLSQWPKGRQKVSQLLLLTQRSFRMKSVIFQFLLKWKTRGRTWHNLNCPHPWPLTVGRRVHPLSLDLANSGHHRAPPPLSAGIVLQVLHVPNRVYCYCYYRKVFRLQLPDERKCFVLFVGCTSTALLRDGTGFGDLGPGTHWRIVKPGARAIRGLMTRPERRIFDEVLLVRYTDE